MHRLVHGVSAVSMVQQHACTFMVAGRAPSGMLCISQSCILRPAAGQTSNLVVKLFSMHAWCGNHLFPCTPGFPQGSCRHWAEKWQGCQVPNLPAAALAKCSTLMLCHAVLLRCAMLCYAAGCDTAGSAHRASSHVSGHRHRTGDHIFPNHLEA